MADGLRPIPYAVFEAAVQEMSKVEKLHPRATLDSLLHAAFPTLGLEVTFDEEIPGA